jgi:hypothetical protein
MFGTQTFCCHLGWDVALSIKNFETAIPFCR